jgi:hypothetical protein
MPNPPPLFLRLNLEIRGPFDWDRLHELAETGIITAATEVSPDRAGPWTPIGEAGDYARVFPPRIHYAFKTRPFQQVNRPADPPADHPVAIAATNEGRCAPAAGRPASTPPPPDDVERILRLNRECERRAGLDRLKPMLPVPNRRRRDYWMLLIGGNLVCLLALNAIGGLALAGVVAGVFTAGLTWLMYGAMDRY